MSYSARGCYVDRDHARPISGKAVGASLTKTNSVFFRFVNVIIMNKLVASLLVTVTVSLPICSASAQVATGSPSATATAQATSTPSPHPNEHRKTGEKIKEVSASDVQEKTWESEVWFPIIRFFGIAVIIGLLLRFIDLPTFLKGDAWPARTVIALILVFSFAAATMINVDDKALTALKDVTLIVVGFYFGAAKAAEQRKEKDKKSDETRGNAHAKEDK
jgi:hypothetical protein